MLGADNANIIEDETRDCEITYELFKCKRHVLIWNGTKTMEEFRASCGTCIEQFILALVVVREKRKIDLWLGLDRVNRVSDNCNHIVRNFNNYFFDICNEQCYFITFFV